MKEAIKKAIEGGYEGLTVNDVDTNNYQWQVIVCDADFWQALGKAEGWEKWKRSGSYFCSHKVKKNGVAEHSPIKGWVHTEGSWLFHWHNFIDHIASGGNAEEFFNNLLTQH